MAPRQVRPIRIEGNIAYVPLSRGYEAIIDAEDVALVEGWNWSVMTPRRSDGSFYTAYAFRNMPRGGKRGVIYMHRVIAKTPDGFLTDHRDGIGLNNRKENLRTATTAQNVRNQGLRIDSTSGFRGVYFDKTTGKWKAEIMADGIRHRLGSYLTAESAASAYERASPSVHGEFGRTR